jgi:predicted AlkP superfamily pyrophosphatase or phosphodiesterase
VTGRRPLSHGILHNETDPPSGFDWDWNWYRSRIRGDTVCDAAHRAGYRTAAILWPAMAGARLDWVLPEIAASHLRRENQELKALRNGTPWFMLRMQLKYGALRRGTSQPWLDDFSAAVAMDLLRRRRGPNLLMLHLVDLDDAKHHSGVGSEEADAACGRTAVRLERLLEAASADPGAAARTPGHGTLLLFGDHAQRDAGRAVGARSRLAAAGLRIRVHNAGGSAFLYPAPGYDETRDAPRLAAFLEAWRAEPDGGLRTWLDRAGMAGAGTGDGRAVALLDAEDGFCFSETPVSVHHATHGHLPGHPGIDSALFAAGAGIQPGRTVDRAEIIDVGPTVAALLGISLPGADGRALPFVEFRSPPRRKR